MQITYKFNIYFIAMKIICSLFVVNMLNCAMTRLYKMVG